MFKSNEAPTHASESIQRLKVLEERVERLQQAFRQQRNLQEKYQNVFFNLAAAFDQFRFDQKKMHLSLTAAFDQFRSDEHAINLEMAMSSNDGSEQQKP